MNSARKKPVIGLLGGVGAGKSTVAGELVGLGCGLIDADAIGHELLGEPKVKAELVRAFGRKILARGAGNVDRTALAEAAFASEDALKSLNAITHPRIRRCIMKCADALQADPAVKAIVLDAALLLETDWHELCTVLVFVSAPGRQRARRVARARGWDASTWERRENSQKALDIKAARADYSVDNSSSLLALRKQVRSVFRRIVH